MGKTSDKSDNLKKEMLLALEKSLGVATTACKNVGIARSTHYEWLSKDVNYRNEVNSIQDIAIDFAESQLHKQISEGNTSATIFFLKTKGKSRGYVERYQIDDISDREPVEVNIIMPNKDRE
jgi:hypothetical protein